MTDAKTTGKHVTETSLGSAASAKWRDTFTEEPDRWKSPRPDLARASGAKTPGATQQRGFGAMAREVIMCTGARSGDDSDILSQTVADL